jgi:acyl-[acyl-carrier-protein]-phospholipid O-acyltransferase/long-chain-fatty-acid--[acyl-carrier-protein] ligase
MLGYFRPENPGRLDPPVSGFGAGWYDTGDIVSVDEDGFVTIQGRAKRFAKIGGEMVSLGVVEDMATRLWPGHLHAAVTLPDERKGERVVLVSQFAGADRTAFTAKAQELGHSELYLPREVRHMKDLPLLATGKVDYPALEARVRGEARA